MRDYLKYWPLVLVSIAIPIIGKLTYDTWRLDRYIEKGPTTNGVRYELETLNPETNVSFNRNSHIKMDSLFILDRDKKAYYIDNWKDSDKPDGIDRSAILDPNSTPPLSINSEDYSVPERIMAGIRDELGLD
jgi:hypothetical protein